MLFFSFVLSFHIEQANKRPLLFFLMKWMERSRSWLFLFTHFFPSWIVKARQSMLTAYHSLFFWQNENTENEKKEAIGERITLFRRRNWNYTQQKSKFFRLEFKSEQISFICKTICSARLGVATVWLLALFRSSSDLQVCRYPFNKCSCCYAMQLQCMERDTPMHRHI